MPHSSVCAIGLVFASVLIRSIHGSTLLHRHAGIEKPWPKDGWIENPPNLKLLASAEIWSGKPKPSQQKAKAVATGRPTAINKRPTTLQASQPHSSQPTAHFLEKKNAGVAPIEDQLMGMTPEMKAAMYNEMTFAGGPVSQAINFVRSHPNDGWTWCANDGQTCQCSGQVRFGSLAGGWPAYTNPLPAAGAVVCSGVNFGSTLPAGPGFHCQCSHASEKQWQNANLHFNSVSYLQEAWISLTRTLAQAKLLPVSGDRSWGGEALFSVRGGGSHDRTFMDIFLTEAAQYLPTTPSNCIEWAPTMYMPRFPGCASGKQYSLDFEPDINKMHVDANNHIHCDNVHLPGCVGATKFDIALNTNVWEHEIEPFAAMQSLYNVLNPGGVMLFTVPFVAPYHGVPYDFYRYTKSGVTHLLERAGFCVPRSRMASGGDFIFDVAMMAGVGPGDFSQAEIQQAYHRGYDQIPDGALVMMAVAYKKVNAADPCPA